MTAPTPPILLNSTIKVLLVEDDRDDAVLTCDLLGESKRAQFSVETVFTYATGVTALKDKVFDVILLDYKLPDGDGLQFVKWVEENKIPVPVIIVTSHGDRNLQVRAVEAGAADYLEKGRLSADVLERSCIYAIGLQERRRISNSPPNVGQLIQQLIELTDRYAQSRNEIDLEVKELRRELAATREEVVNEIHSLTKFRWLLDWVTKHPIASLVIFACLILAGVMMIGAIEHVDLEKIHQLLQLKKSALMLGVPFSWTA